MKLLVTISFGGIMLAGFGMSVFVLPISIVTMDRMACLGAAIIFLGTVTVYYYFRVAVFILWKFKRRGCKEASLDSVLVDGPHYSEFVTLHVWLRELTAAYSDLLSDDEVLAAVELARRHRVAAWVSGTTYVTGLAVTAILAAFGVIEPTG